MAEKNAQAGQSGGMAQSQEPIYSLRLCEGLVVPGAGIITLLEASPKGGGLAWNLEWHKVGVRCSVKGKPAFDKFGAWIVTFSNIASIQVSVPEEK